MTIAATSSTVGRSLLRHAPLLALILAVIAAVMLVLGPIGWRAGWWHFRFAFLTLMPWAAYFGIAALIVAALSLLLGRSRIEWRGIAIAAAAFAAGALIAYVPWHYDQMRQTVPPIHDITTDTDNPPAFAAVVTVRTARVPVFTTFTVTPGNTAPDVSVMRPTMSAVATCAEAVAVIRHPATTRVTT